MWAVLYAFLALHHTQLYVYYNNYYYNFLRSCRVHCCWCNYCPSSIAGGHLCHHRSFDHCKEKKYEKVCGEIFKISGFTQLYTYKCTLRYSDVILLAMHEL